MLGLCTWKSAQRIEEYVEDKNIHCRDKDFELRFLEVIQDLTIGIFMFLVLHAGYHHNSIVVSCLNYHISHVSSL